jgi:hypothetical protein
LDTHKPNAAFLGTSYVGTHGLGRPLSAAEAKDLASLLRKHDFVGASLVSLNFALKLTRSKPAAQDLRDRAHLRLVEQGWDPGVVTLAKCLCRFVWSEHKNETRRRIAERNAEDIFLREQEAAGHTAAPSAEDLAVRLETERKDEERAAKRTASLRAAFVHAGDAINQVWLDHWLAGVEEPGEMARLSGRNVNDFYRAADRRKRHVARLLAAESGATFEEDE